MDEQTVRKLVELERRQDTQELPEKSSDLVSPFLALSALRAFWPMSAVDYTNPQARDLGGGGYHLTNNNTATFGYDPTRVLIPCAFFDGTNQYLSRADGGAANWADITGTEAFIENTLVGARGLTFGGWFYPDNDTGATAILMGKVSGGPPNRAYQLNWNDPTLFFQIGTAAATFTVTSTTAMSLDTWTFVVGRFDPSTELKIWNNGATDTNVVAIPAAIQDTGSAFTIGATAVPGNYLDGRASLCFLCAAALADATIDSIFNQTRGAFGV